MTARPGVTLLELMVVLTILSVTAAVTGVAVRRAQPVHVADLRAAAIARARRMAIHSGHPVTASIDIDSVLAPITALPGGSVIADSTLHVDRLTGGVREP
jgi:prepilin-type N-terminal cleavage/methylation domain-containing protein